MLLDVAYSDDGAFEISFDYNIPATYFEWHEFESVIKRGKALADIDR